MTVKACKPCGVTFPGKSTWNVSICLVFSSSQGFTFFHIFMRNRKYPSHSQPVCQHQLAATMLFVGDLKVKGMPDCINNEYVASKLSKTIYNADFCYYIKEKLQFVEFVFLSSLKFTVKWQSKILDWCCCKELILDSVTKLGFLKSWCCGLNRVIVKTEQDVVKWPAAQATAHVGSGDAVAQL